MEDRCILQADFSATRIIAGRKCLQLIFEVPIEAADDAMAKLGGFPQPGENRWVAIALLDTKIAATDSINQSMRGTSNPEIAGATPAPALQVSEANGSSKKWADYSRSQQAAILCQDPEFQRYFGAQNTNDAAVKLKDLFHISSRSVLDNYDMEANWSEFVALYNLHRERVRPLRGAKNGS